MRDILEQKQVWIYFGCVALGVVAALLFSGTEKLEGAINPALAFMLFVTFLQVPMAEIGKGLREARFLMALLTSNFIAIPVLVFALSNFAIDDPLLKLGIFMVLLTPCIDYVITFAHLGRSNARLLLTSTPILLLLQMVLFPLYLTLFLGDDAAQLMSIEPFIHAFLWVIALPLFLASIVQLLAMRSHIGQVANKGLGLMPVPATAVVLFLVVAATFPILDKAASHALLALPIYIAFAVIAPFVGWGVSWLFSLQSESARAVSFSSATRNSLVVLPLALAVPGAAPVLPAVIVMQTLVELVAELFYIRLIPQIQAYKA